MHIDLAIGDMDTSVTGIGECSGEIAIIENGMWHKNIL